MRGFRIVVACIAGAAAFFLTWWLCQSGLNLERGTSLALGGLATTLVLLVLATWAAAPRPAGRNGHPHSAPIPAAPASSGPSTDTVGSDAAITVLHLSGAMSDGTMSDSTMSDLTRRAGNSTAEGAVPLADRDAELLQQDLRELTRKHGLPSPDVVVMAGNVAAHARPHEYESALAFLTRLQAGLRLDTARVVVVPGSHDVSREKCAAYFLDRQAYDEPAFMPYWPKWEPFAEMFTRFYGGEFRKDQPWQLIELPALKLTVAALNSTMAESHREPDQYGWLGEEQLRWFAERMTHAEARGWFRLGVVHHSPERLGNDSTSLRDAELFSRLLAPRLNVVLHAHSGTTKERRDATSAPVVLGLGEDAGGARGDRSQGISRYQVVEIRRDGLRVWGRRYHGGSRQWVDDPGPGGPRRRGPRLIAASFARVGGVFSSPHSHESDWDGLLSRIAELYRLRLPGAVIRERPAQRGAPGYLDIEVPEATGSAPAAADRHLVGACRDTVTRADVDRFVAAVNVVATSSGTPSNGSRFSLRLAYEGPPPTTEVREHAQRAGVQVLSFAEFQHGPDLRPFDLLSRMAEVCHLRLPAAVIQEVRPPGRGPGYLHVAVAQQFAAGVPVAVKQYPVGACLRTATAEDVDHFVATADAHYREGPAAGSSSLVYQGSPSTAEVRDYARRKGVELLSFAEFQLGFDLRPYAQRQFEELAHDPLYPQELYVPQRWVEVGPNGRPLQSEPQQDILDRLRSWLADPDGGLVAVLGPFGHGKTFLLRELARRMHADRDPAVPVLVSLGKLEKTHALDEMVAARLVAGGERRIDLEMFRYLLREGRIALLFDGFDELALRVSYEKAAEHLAAVVQAAEGNAKVVFTSRDEYFINDEEVITALGRRLGASSGRRLVKLAGFDEQQIRDFLTRRFGSAADADERMELLHEIRDLTGLSRNPRMLSFVADIGLDRLRAARNRSEGLTAADLYREILDQWLTGEHHRLNPPGSAPGPSLRALWLAVTTLAVRLWGSAESSLSIDDLGETADDLLKLTSVDGQLDSPSDRREVIHVIGSGTLLVREGDGRFLFVHLSIVEWLVARHIADCLEQGDPMPAPLLRKISDLLADFLGGLAGTEAVARWVRAGLASDQAPGAARDNALLLATRLQIPIAEPIRLAGQDLSGQDLSHRDLTGADLSGAILTEARMMGTTLVQARLDGATLRRAQLDGSRLTGAVLRDADLTGARLLGVDLTGADLSGARLGRASLLGATLPAGGVAGAADIRGAALPGAGPPQLQFRSRAAGMRGVAVSADLVAAGGDDGVVRIWDNTTGMQLREWSGHHDEVLSVAFTTDGRRLASAGASGTVKIWDPATATLLREWPGHPGRAWSVAFSSSGHQLASAGGDGRVRVWDSATGTPVYDLMGHVEAVWSVQFSPDGRWLASGGTDGVLRIWDNTNGSLAHELAVGTGAVLGVAFSPDGRQLASTGADRVVRVWDPASGTQHREWVAHKGAVWSLAYSPHGWLTSAGDDGVVRIWDPATGSVQRELLGHTDEVNSVAFSPDGRWLASTGADQVVRMWDPATGTLVREWTGHAGAEWSVAFSPDGRWLACGGTDPVVRIWDGATGALLRTLRGHEGAVWSTTFSADGRWLACGGTDGVVRIWDPSSGALLRSLDRHAGAVWSVAVSADCHRLAVAGDAGVLRIWDPADGKLRREWDGHTGRVRSVRFSPDSQSLASGGDDWVVRLWHPDTGRQRGHDWADHGGAVWSVGFSPSGQWLAATGTAGMVRLWNPASGEVRAWPSHTGAVWSVGFSPDGGSLVSAGTAGQVQIWDPVTGRAVRSLQGHTGAVWSVGYSPDGRRLASVGTDRVLRLWDPETGTRAAALLALADGWAAMGTGLRYKLAGNPAGEFWYVLGMCRFEPGELDQYLPTLVRRVPLDDRLA